MAGIRRTWDKQAYEAKAALRAELGDEAVDIAPEKKRKAEVQKEEFQPAPEGADGPMGSQRAYIKARQEKIDLESKAGKTQVVTNPEGSAGAGWWCDVCKCLLKDSVSYMDHINGKKHQRALGYSMRVERADLSMVQQRLQLIKNKIIEEKTGKDTTALEDYETRIAVQLAEEERRKKQKKEEAAARKREAELAELEHIDPDIAEIMGFGGFQSKNK